MAARPATPSLLRTINDRSAFDLLLTEGPMTRVELGKRTGLSKVTASQLLARLQRRGLVEVVGSRSAGRGPSAEVYAVRPGCSFSVGVDLNPDHADVAIADVTGTTVARLRRPVSHQYMASAAVSRSPVAGSCSALHRSAAHRLASSADSRASRSSCPAP